MILECVEDGFGRDAMGGIECVMDGCGECKGTEAPEFPCLMDVYDDDEICRVYMRCIENSKRPISPEMCIDPRHFYERKSEVCASKDDICNEQEEVSDVKMDVRSKPSFSYAQIITQAIVTSENGKLTLNEIYQWIENSFEYYRYANPVWKNSIRHNLSLNKCFKKVPRDPGARGKGGRWTLDHEVLTNEDAFKKKKAPRCDGTIDESAQAQSKQCIEPEYGLSDEQDDEANRAFGIMTPENLMRQMSKLIVPSIGSGSSVK
ncbi:forkhead domain-containing protein [Ordospora pajunii]|uniref:forkhead domain-containing protein n=1 Tax=Ordospora pajunii TaxID=3039483 RepID=UPI00295262DA|nr:forkhead domain-containing protein [Ordospora pajunii]KAH9410657.1 forkhead domain-containing protein [Ordospora pajunii]